MNPSMPTDQEIARELRGALRAEAERIAPEPALQRILARAHEGGRARTDRSRAERRRRWLPALAGAVATAGIAAAAIVIFAPSDEPTGPAQPPPCAVEVREGCPVDLAVWFQTPGGNELISGGFTVSSVGNVGIDAVQTLLTEQPPRFSNPWPGLADVPVAQVNSVRHDDGVVTVDFDRQLQASASMEGANSPLGELTVQQLVLTVQSALRTDDPVLITVNGEEADEAFGYPLDGPEPADWSLVSGIRPDRPTQQSVVESPVTVSGTSTTNEGTITWSITRSGDRLRQDFVTDGGSSGTYAPFEFDIDVPPGDYTLKLWEASTASGAEAWTEEIGVVYIDFTVE
jgi:Immunoglobulin-like domain of bacterial spore germination/Sporulation and spore germination